MSSLQDLSLCFVDRYGSCHVECHSKILMEYVEAYKFEFVTSPWGDDNCNQKAPRQFADYWLRRLLDDEDCNCVEN